MNRLLLFIALALPLQGFAQYRDTVVVDNAVFQRLSVAATDSFLTINRAGVVSYVYMPPTSYKDSIYWQPGGVTSPAAWVKAGDTIYIDTTATAVIDTFIVKILRVDSLYVTTVTIDTIHMGTDTIYSMGQLRDSVYLLPGTSWGAAGWLSHGDTLMVDTTGGGVDSYWQRSGERLTPAETMDSVYTAHGGMAPVIVYGSNIVSNGGFETYTGHSGGLAQFTDWLNGTTQSGYIDTAAGYVGAYSVKLSDGGTQSANILQQSRSMTSGVRYKLSFYHKGAAMVYQLYRGTTGFNASTGAWAFPVVSNTIPAATNWTRYDINFTAPTTASNYELKFDQATNGSTTYIDAVQIATFAEHMAITSSYPLHFTATKYLVKSLTATTSDTALILRGDTLYKGKVTMDVPVNSLKINGIWYFSGDSLTIAIDYDSINIDSLITGALIDSIITTINIDSITQLIVIGYLDTSSAVRDTFEVVYGTTQQPGWVSSGDQIYIDTSGQVVDTFQLSGDFLEISLSEVNEVHRVFLGKYVDSLYVEYCDGCALTSGLVLSGNTIYIDTARRQDTIVSSVITSDTITSIVVNVDTIYIGGDTLTSSDYIWRKGNAGVNNAQLRSGSNYLSGNHAIVIGTLDTVTGTGAFAMGWWTKASATAAIATGYATEAAEIGAYSGGTGTYSGGILTRVRATGAAAFNHSMVEGGATSVASGVASAVLGGRNNSATGTGTVVLGGDGITGTANYTTYVNDLRAGGEIYLSDTSYIDEVGGWLYMKADGFLFQADTSYIALTSRTLRPYTSESVVDIGDTLVRFNDAWFNGRVTADQLQIADNAAAGRVLVAQNSDGLAKWEPVSELTGTADTFYLPGEGWLQSGDTITLPVVDSSKWSRSTGRLVSKHVGDTVGVDQVGSLWAYKEYLSGQLVGDTTFSCVNGGEFSCIFESSSILDSVQGRLDHVAAGYGYNDVSTIIHNHTPVEGEINEFSLWYKGDSLSILLIGYNEATYDWHNNIWVYDGGTGYETYYTAPSVDWVQLVFRFPSKIFNFNQSANFIIRQPILGNYTIIDDISWRIVKEGIHITSTGNIHLTATDSLLLHNLPAATTDTLLGLDGDRVVKTAITFPDVDSSKWALSGTSLRPKSTSYNVGIGNTSPAYKLDVTGAAYFSNRIYFGSTTGHIQGDGSGGVYVTGPTSGALTIAPGANPLYSFMETAVTLYSHNTIDLGATSSRFKNIYAGTKMFTPKLQLSSLSTNTTSTDVLVLNGSEVEKRTGYFLWYPGTGTDAYMQRTGYGNTASGNHSLVLGVNSIASGRGSLAGGNWYTMTSGYSSVMNTASGIGAFSWQTGGAFSTVGGQNSFAFGMNNFVPTIYSGAAGSANILTANGAGDNAFNFIFGSEHIVDSVSFAGALSSEDCEIDHEGAAMISTQGRSSVAEWTLHTDNMHVYDTATIGEVLTLTSIADLPTSPVSGMLVNHAGVLKFYNGSTWKTISFD